MRRALVFQHMDADHLGRFAHLLRADGITTDTVMLHQGGAIPSLAPYDLLIVLGGAMDVWMEDEHPWLRDEKAAIREWVGSRARPYLGICLGHQLLADAMGGKVGKAATHEIGVHEISRTHETHRLFEGLSARMPVFEWHHCEVQELPGGAVNLASSPTSAVQAMAMGENALGLQFHAEFDMASIEAWAGIPSYITAMERALGPGSYPRVKEQARAMMEDYDRLARRLWENLKAAACANPQTTNTANSDKSKPSGPNTSIAQPA